MSEFTGFPKEGIQFLTDLEKHNNREWFQERKEQYESLVRTPALEFITAMATPLAELAPHFVAVPKKSGGSLMRPYRDIRFSPDKSPYKTNIGIQFRHELGKDAHAPGFYVHVAPQECFVGVGMWRPESSALLNIRNAIVDSESEYRSIIESPEFTGRFALGGESLKRPPRGFDAEHPLIDELKRKDFIASHEVSPAQVTSPDFVETVAGSFRIAVPFIRFLCGALGIAY